MNRSEFIKEIMSLYPHTFDVDNEAQYSGWIKRYQQIPENWDFDKLMIIFSKNWRSTREAPSPSWFMDFREDVKPVKKATCLTEHKTTEKLISAEQMQELRKKIFNITEHTEF